MSVAPESQTALVGTETSTSTGSYEQPDYDVGLFLNEHCPDTLKRYIISTIWTAPPGFVWPHNTDNSKQYGEKNIQEAPLSAAN